MLSASREDRAKVSSKLRDLLVELADHAVEVCDEHVGTRAEHWNTDRHQLEICLLTQAQEFQALLIAYVAERHRLAAAHDQITAEEAAHERANASLGLGHLQSEMV